MTTTSPGHQPADAGAGGTTGGTRSVGEIVGDLSRDLSTLVRQEIDLGKNELRDELKKSVAGAGMLAAAGLAGLLMLIVVSLAFAFWIDNALPLETATFIVAAFWLLLAVVLGLLGRKRLQAAQMQLPTTQKTIQQDVQWAKEQTR